MGLHAPTDRATVEGRQIVDTRIEGMSAAGHEYGGDLGDADVEALLGYRLTL